MTGMDCLFQGAYPLNQCLCRFDACLQKLYDQAKPQAFASKCPTCAQYTTPKATTQYDWDGLFATEDPTTNATETPSKINRTESYPVQSSEGSNDPPVTTISSVPSLCSAEMAYGIQLDAASTNDTSGKSYEICCCNHDELSGDEIEILLTITGNQTWETALAERPRRSPIARMFHKRTTREIYHLLNHALGQALEGSKLACSNKRPALF